MRFENAVKSSAILVAALCAGISAKTAQPAMPTKSRALDLHWAYVNVDTVASGASTIAVDGNGKIKVGYRSSHDIKYGIWADGHWTTERADSGTGGDAQMTMALDKDGNPRIVYHDATYHSAIYAWKEGNVWKDRVAAVLNIENLDFYQSSIRVNADGDTYMCFAVKDAGWPAISVTKVAKNGDLTGPTVIDHGSGKWNTMALDGNGQPRTDFTLNPLCHKRASY